MSHTSLTYHLIFVTYRRHNSINIEHEKELYKYMFDFATKRGVTIRRIGGMPDHVHILCDIPAKDSVAEFVKILKAESSKFMRVNSNFTNRQGWAEGYAGFTIDASSRQSRIEYIRNQKEHHKRISFIDEYRQFLIDSGITDFSHIPGDTEG